MYDFLKEHEQQLVDAGCAVTVYPYHQAVVLKYWSGFTTVLLDTDFPYRNKYPVYRIVNGKSVLSGWEDGKDVEAGVSVKRFLESGKQRYIPENTKPAKLTESAELLARMAK